MILRPRLSEKSYGLSQLRNTYVFDVPTDANKMAVSDAVAAQYGVNVFSVNILNQNGKAMRTVRKGGRAVNGTRSDYKKAYVTLKQGESLPVFAALEEAAEPAAKEKK
jgi:large subunit ribosomal protein L23